MRNDGVIAAAIRAAKYADAVMRRTATGGDMQSCPDPFDPRLLGASRQAQLSPDDAENYISQQMAQGEPDDNNWFAQFDNPHNLSSLPPGHKWVRFRDEMYEDPDEDPRYFQAVPETTPEGHEQWHVRGAEGGWRYDPDELEFYDRLPPGLQRGEFGIWEPIKNTGHEGFDPDDNPDPFDPRLIGASRRTAALDQPHHDWRPRYGDDPKIQKWHPPYGETHVKYDVWRGGGGNNPIVWTATHQGLATGETTFKSPLDLDDRDHTRTVYEHEDDPERIGRFRTPEQAKAAAEKHYEQNYKNRPKMDGLDVDRVMREHGDQPRAGTGLGDDEDYGHIFGMLRQAGWDMADIVRLAGDGMSWEDTMRHIDRVLAEGEPGTDEGRLPETESLLYEDYRNGPIPEQVQHEEGQCRNCGKSVVKQLGTGRWLDLWHFSPACDVAGTTENPRGRLLLHEVSNHPTPTGWRW